MLTQFTKWAAMCLLGATPRDKLRALSLYSRWTACFVCAVSVCCCVQLKTQTIQRWHTCFNVISIKPEIWDGPASRGGSAANGSVHLSYLVIIQHTWQINDFCLSLDQKLLKPFQTDGHTLPWAVMSRKNSFFNWLGEYGRPDWGKEN